MPTLSTTPIFNPSPIPRCRPDEASSHLCWFSLTTHNPTHNQIFFLTLYIDLLEVVRRIFSTHLRVTQPLSLSALFPPLLTRLFPFFDLFTTPIHLFNPLLPSLHHIILQPTTILHSQSSASQNSQSLTLVVIISNSVPEFLLDPPDMDMEFFTNVMGSSLVKGKRSRRFRPWFNSGEEQQGPWSCSESTQEDEHESEDEEMAAHSLMLLSHGASSAVNHVPNPSPSKRVIKKAKESHSADSPYHGEKKSSYKCKTCSKVFLSFQALGGHRASCSHTTTLAHHTTAESEQANEKNSNKMRVHECPICYRVFSSGQALGGHKRTHSTTPPPPMASSATENEYEQRAELDLNMPAPLDDCYSLTEDSSAVPCSVVVRSHYNEYKPSPPFWWMNNNGKRFPLVYNGGAADEAESKVLLGQDLGLNQDLFMVATVN